MSNPTSVPTIPDRADRAPSVQQSRTRTARQQQVIIDAARRLIDRQGAAFTTQELIKEAGVALQTFYRYFEGKDQLVLAVIEDLIAEAATAFAAQARDLPDPVARLRFHVMAVAGAVDRQGPASGAQFVTAEHWRLYQRFPREVSRATQPITDLIEHEIRAAAAEGLLRPVDPAQDAWLTTQLLMSVFHHYAFLADDEHRGNIAENLWSFCAAAYGIPEESEPGSD